MNVVRETVCDSASAIAVAENAEDLRVFMEPASAATIWRRETAHPFQAWIDALAPDRLPNGRIVLRRTAVRDAVRELCEIAETPDCAERTWLMDDVAALSDMFADLLQAEYLRLRLDRVSTNACRKFHVDAITARLVCTYRGAGTQYGVSADGSDPCPVFDVPTGSPVLLRGTKWPPAPASGLLHRSPPIEGTGETRLVLVIDPIFDPDEEA